MSDQKFKTGIDETLSAFLDGEASPEEMHALLEAMNRDPRLHAAIDHHHHLRAGLRGELHPGLGAGFADRVLAAIEDLESAMERKSTPISAAAVRHARPWLRGTLGLAMAASLAAVVVLAAQMLLPPADPAFSTAHVKEERIALPALTQARVETGSQNRRDSRSWSDLTPDAAAELSNYLISHQNSAMDHGFGGSMGYMRVAADDGLAYRGADR